MWKGKHALYTVWRQSKNCVVVNGKYYYYIKSVAYEQGEENIFFLFLIDRHKKSSLFYNLLFVQNEWQFIAERKDAKLYTTNEDQPKAQDTWYDSKASSFAVWATNKDHGNSMRGKKFAKRK